MPDDRGMAERILDMFHQRVGDLAGQLNAGEIDLVTWQVTMRDELRQLYSLQLIAAAKGNRELVPLEVWKTAEDLLGGQYKFLRDFAREIAQGNLSEAQIAARAGMYVDSAKQMYWKQLTSKADLPAQPGDGSSECLGNCGCEWAEEDDGWHWLRGKNDSCDTCLAREAQWRPYVA